jgi:hypothetical protein
MFMIQKVRRDAAGHITMVEWQKSNAAQNGWMDRPMVTTPVVVAKRLAQEMVGTVVPAGDLLVPGPYVVAVTLPSGQITLDAAQQPGMPPLNLNGLLTF